MPPYTNGPLAWLCVLGAFTAVVGCDEECVDTEEGGVCVSAYDTGYYYDSLVTGVTYENRNEDGVVRTSVTGLDDDPGSFRFLEGQTVAFSLGDTELGESSGQARVTPFDLTGVSEETVGGCDVTDPLPDETDPFRKVAHLAVLLQTLDHDGDSTAGIEISAEVADLFDGVTVEVDQVWTDFQTDLQAVLDEAISSGALPAGRVMLEREEALRALYVGIGRCEP